MLEPAQGIAEGQGAVAGDFGALEREVLAREAQGAVRAALGSCPMPDGYALMQDLADGTFYWLRENGLGSPRHHSRWEVWEMAYEDSRNPDRWMYET